MIIKKKKMVFLSMLILIKRAIFILMSTESLHFCNFFLPMRSGGHQNIVEPEGEELKKKYHFEVQNPHSPSPTK